MSNWEGKRTLLIVGEGRHEEAFISHTTQLFVPRGQNLMVKVKQAGGKGAAHVVNYTCRQIANIAYDHVAALLDTDNDWTDTVRKKAKRNKITVLCSDPCLEAMLLRVLGKPAHGDAKALKKQFMPYVSGDAADPRNYASHFDRARLLAARHDEPTINLLLKLLDA